MAQNEKLLTSLRLNLSELQKDADKANSILKTIQDTKIEGIDMDGPRVIMVL